MINVFPGDVDMCLLGPIGHRRIRSLPHPGWCGTDSLKLAKVSSHADQNHKMTREFEENPWETNGSTGLEHVVIYM